jgi:hypothetical protein
LVRPDIVELRDRVKVVADPALGKHDDELSAKFRDPVGPVLGAERTETLLETCWHVDELTDLSMLLAQTVPALDG